MDDSDTDILPSIPPVIKKAASFIWSIVVKTPASMPSAIG